MVVCKTRRFRGQGIRIRRLDDGIARAPQIAIALIICDHQDNVRLLGLSQGASQQSDEEQRQDAAFHAPNLSALEPGLKPNASRIPVTLEGPLWVILAIH